MMLQEHFNEVLKVVDNPQVLNLFIGPNFLQPVLKTRNLSSRNSTTPSSLKFPSAVSSSKTMSSRATPGGDRSPSAARPSAQPRGLQRAGSQPVQRDDLSTCHYCQRRFAADRLQIHEDICSRTGKKKRKVYDATKHRLAGTELEPFVKKSVKIGVTKPSGHSKGNWRQKHEEFIGTIRAAKQAQDYIAKGGNLRDLPPPPPSVNPDYVQCPHCGRRFNQSAAERHIPKCATYEFNKPKGNANQARPSRSTK